MMLLKWLLVVLGFWWLAHVMRRAWRQIVSGAKPPRNVERPPGQAAGKKADLSDLTQQEISDADYEEIP